MPRKAILMGGSFVELLESSLNLKLVFRTSMLKFVRGNGECVGGSCWDKKTFGRWWFRYFSKARNVKQNQIFDSPHAVMA